MSLNLKRALIILIVVAASVTEIFAQERCGVMVEFNVFQTSTPKNRNFEEWIVSKRTEGSEAFSSQDDVYRLPIVFHVLHSGEPIGEGGNLPDAQIIEQVRTLSNDFRRKNPDASETPISFQNVAADAHIEFVLARIDPSGKPSTGIVRVDMRDFNKTPYQYMSYWPAEDYINVWVIDYGTPYLAGSAVFPVAPLPGLENSGDDRLTDGITMNAMYLGQGKHTVEMSRGRTLTHEMGHFLGLIHVWGQTPFQGDGCSVDDYCEDTPNSAGPNYDCNVPVSCDGKSPAMIQNYMDYTDDECMNLFTMNQVERMRIVLEGSPRRKSLRSSPGLGTPENSNPEFALYPNPTKDFLQVTFDVKQFPNATIEIFNIFGQKILESQLYSQSTTIDMREYERGSYLVTIGNLSKRNSYRVILID